MMRKVAKIAAWTLLFYTLTIIMLPKERFWYLLEEKMHPVGAVIDGETIRDYGAGLDIASGSLYFGALRVADFSQADMKLWLLANHISLQKLHFGKGLAMLKGIDIDELGVFHSLIAPMTLYIKGVGSFGSFEGEISLSERRVEITVQPSPLLQKNSVIMRLLKKSDEGYRYASTF